ncbi:MAG: hypothetical protein HUJ98_04490 [Bacteroidaceae bacterium]|nr:hypothetical protein [Bacteroidaceae bacterium]
MPPSANLPAIEAKTLTTVAIMLAMAAKLAGNGKAAPEAVPLAIASASFAETKATI